MHEASEKLLSPSDSRLPGTVAAENDLATFHNAFVCLCKCVCGMRYFGDKTSLKLNTLTIYRFNDDPENA